MDTAKIIEGGIAGATTLTLLEKALQDVDTKTPRLKLLNKPGIIKRLRKQSKKKGSKKIFVQVAKELLTAGTYYGIVRLGSKKNALLRGALLGAATGLGVVIAENKKDKKSNKTHIKKVDHTGTEPSSETDKFKFWIKNNRDEILTVALYAAGGILAGATIKKLNKKTKKK
jgi:hypothetical protein